MKKKLLALLSILLIVALSALSFSACSDKKQSEYVSHNVYLKEDGTLKILQITDTHFINSDHTDKTVDTDYSLRDPWAMETITYLVEQTKPDLLALTGDAIYTNFLVKMVTKYTNTDNEAAFKKFAKFIDSFNIPWFFCFGNHDEEGDLLEEKGSADAVKRFLGDYLCSDEIKNCLYASGPDDINGQGNYIINVLNADDSVNTSLVVFDSGSYFRLYDEKLDKQFDQQQCYEYVHDDQLDWYEKAIRDISDIEGHLVPSIVFQHIPMPVYKTVIEEFTAALEAKGEDWLDTVNKDWTYNKELTLDTAVGPITYHGGIYEDSPVCSSYVGTIKVGTLDPITYDGGHEFERLLSLGSTKYVFCGHDHRNTFSFTYKGIRLTYGMSIDYSANGTIPPPMAQNQTIYNDTQQRGGTLITINSDSSVGIEQVPFPYNLYQREVEARSK